MKRNKMTQLSDKVLEIAAVAPDDAGNPGQGQRSLRALSQKLSRGR